jgi:hypothetical protein
MEQRLQQVRQNVANGHIVPGLIFQGYDIETTWEPLCKLLNDFDHFRALRFIRCNISSESLIKFMRSLHRYKLSSIGISGTPVDENVMAAVVAMLEETPRMNRIALRQCDISDKTFPRLVHALKNSGLLGLDVCGNHIQKTFCNLVHVLRHESTCLRRLLLSGNFLDDDNLIAIADVLGHTHIDELGVGSHRVTPRGLGHLVDVLSKKTNKVVKLDLSTSAHMMRESADIVQRMLRETNLECLALLKCELTSEHLDAIAIGVKDSLTLEELDVRQNPNIRPDDLYRFLDLIGPHRAFRKLITEYETSVQQKISARLARLHTKEANMKTLLLCGHAPVHLSTYSALPRELMRVWLSMF